MHGNTYGNLRVDRLQVIGIGSIGIWYQIAI